MTKTMSDDTRLASLYGAMTSLDRVLQVLERNGIDLGTVRAADLFERDLDCQNLGAFEMVKFIVETLADGAPDESATVLDVGCGMGGPGRFLAGRFGCKVTGIDVLPLRIECAQALTARTGLSDRVGYRIADVTSLPFDSGSFAQVWMLDVGIHVRDKTAMFSEIARVLAPGGLFVMHDQTGPLTSAMRPVTKLAPYFAPSLPRLVRSVEDAGLRVRTWQDSTEKIIAYFEQMAHRYGFFEPEDDASRDKPWRALARLTTLTYWRALQRPSGRTGVLIAVRR